MSSDNRKQKKFRFKLKDMEWIDKLFDMRDKTIYRTQDEYATHIFRIFYESDIVSDDDMDQELIKICVAEELIKSSDYFVCSRGGTCSTYKQYLKRKRPYIFKIGKEAMTLDTVKRICSQCYINSKQHRRYINSAEYKRTL